MTHFEIKANYQWDHNITKITLDKEVQSYLNFYPLLEARLCDSIMALIYKNKDNVTQIADVYFTIDNTFIDSIKAVFTIKVGYYSKIKGIFIEIYEHV